MKKLALTLITLLATYSITAQVQVVGKQNKKGNFSTTSTGQQAEKDYEEALADGNDYSPADTIELKAVSQRLLIKKPSTYNLQSNEDCQVVLRVKIDENGNVIDAVCDRNRTTTMNQKIINQVLEIVKVQTKYNEKKGMSVDIKTLIINVSAN